MRGRAQTLVKLSGPGNGFEALRSIYADYRPQGTSSEHSLIITIVQPRWWSSPEHGKRNFLEVLADWDQLCSQYTMMTNEPISDRLKCATIIGYAPQDVKRMLDAANSDVRENQARMRARIREHCLEKNPRAFVPKAPMESDPMEVGAIGFDRPRCNNRTRRFPVLVWPGRQGRSRQRQKG